jgi:hypothetical protein
MPKLVIAIVLISTVALCACAPTDTHHSHFDQRPETVTDGLSPDEKPSTTPVTPEMEAKNKRSLQIRQEIFDFMESIKPMMTHQFSKPEYNQDDIMKYFVGHRCRSLVKKMASAPKTPTNLFYLLEKSTPTYSTHDLGDAACDITDEYTHVTVVPNLLISRHRFESHMIGPNDDESLDIILGPNLTVSAFKTSSGPLDRYRNFYALTDGGALITHSSDGESHDFFTSLNRFGETVTVDAIDGTYSFNDNDYPSDRCTMVSGNRCGGTSKSLELKDFEKQYDLKVEEFVPTQRGASNYWPGRNDSAEGGHCSMKLLDPKTGGVVESIDWRGQCFPEYRY